ncbi:TRAP-type mannitol/chloroaromatic compound transport system, small permease component [Faunimonas pinastri]|uniref:TRAP transporter small permease protein n=1 Tax=Faunimonas pinastri TaxID=1855383 RepID=A0A1H9B455_9HYPH|nr:TRAP transporter small permease [Faunimonas pinastri]SEP83812.1 TRAP-type mannitol/chloroaromatic compound transport system, small permease component [Faunimonas pinastri]
MPSSAPVLRLAALSRRAEALARYAVWFSGALTLASVLLISVDVLARKFLGRNTGAADELSSYAFAISTSWSLAFATLQRANVRVDVLYQRLPVRLSAVLDWLSLVAMGVFMAFLTYYALGVVQASWDQHSTANTPLATPLYIPQGLWFLGLLFMCLILALMLLRASVALVTGDLDTVREICGVRSTREEAEDEAEAGERMVRGESA